jgi:hypothetical protein
VWVYVTHWIATADPEKLKEQAEPLQAANRQVQRALRLLNDLATPERDTDFGSSG